MTLSEKVPTVKDVYFSVGASLTLFVGFILFANVLHSLKCGYWCNMLFGSA